MSGGRFITHVVIIPAYRPSPTLVGFIAALVERNIPGIVLIDDGSGPEYQVIFDQVTSISRVFLLRHARNRGKGAALKTGIQFALRSFPALIGIVTADADGQHLSDDVNRVLQASIPLRQGRLVLGARSFGGAVPLRSRVGNILTRDILRSLFGWKLTDTQTGLRAIPVAMLSRLLQLPSERYEFELEMLLLARQMAIPIVEIPIRTIYEGGNRTSNFRPVVDSARIYAALLRFCFASWRESRLLRSRSEALLRDNPGSSTIN